MGLPEYIKSADELPTHVDRQRTPKTSALMKAILPGLKNPLVYQKCLEENQDILLRLLPTSTCTIAIVKDRLCRLSSQDRQQPQPYNKGQLQFTSYKKSADKMKKSGKRHDKDNTFQDKDGMKRQDCHCCGTRPAHPKSVSSQRFNVSQLW